MTGRTGARLALAFVLVSAFVALFLWVKSRPSLLLWKTHRALGEDNQAAQIRAYERLLRRTDLPAAEEAQLRRAFGEFYLRAVQESATAPLTQPSDHPFLAEAREQFDRVLELSPNDAEARYYLGRILWLQRLEQFAIDELEAAHRVDPRNPQPLAFLAHAYHDRGDSLRARDMAQQALAIDPTNDNARLALVSSYSTLGEYDRAIDEYARLSMAVRADPRRQAEHARTLARGNLWTEAWSAMERAVGAAPNDGWVRGLQGTLLLETGRIDEAVAVFSQALSLMPRSAWPLAWQVSGLAARGDCDGARRLATILGQALPRWPRAQVAQARAELCGGDHDAALWRLDEALRLAPHFDEAVRLKAEILLDSRRYDALGSLLRPLLDRKTQQGAAYAWLARSLIDQKKFGLAEEAAMSALTAYPRQADAHVALSEIAAARGDENFARRSLARAAELRPFDREIAARRLSMSGPERAVGAIAELVQQEPRNPRLWVALGRTQKEALELVEAIQSFQNALAIRPYLMEAHIGLIECLMTQGERGRAEAAFAEASRINRGDPEIDDWRRRLGRSAR